MAAPKRRRQPTITERGSSLSVRVSLRDPDTGTRRQVRVTAATADELDRKVTMLKAQHHAGTLTSPNLTPLADWLSAWLATSQRQSSTVRGHLNHVRLHIAPQHIGSIAIGKLRPLHVQTWVDALVAQGYAPGTVRVIYKTLAAGLSRAVRLQVIPASPAVGIDLPSIPRAQWTILTEQQAALLIEGTRGERYHALWVLAVMVGLRMGELVGLRWADIDWQRGTLTIQRTLRTQKSGPPLVSPLAKSAAGNRTIALPERCLQALREQRAAQNERRLALGRAWVASDAVFDKSIGQHWSNPTGLWVAFRATTQRLGLPDLRPHDCRHTAFSMMLAHGVPLAAVSKIAGHSNPAVTARLYAHSIPNTDAAIAAQIDAMYGVG